MPNTPEAVAFALFKRITKADPSLVTGSASQPIAAAMLDLFAECLKAAEGEREIRGQRTREQGAELGGGRLQ
jgi:hypothetical protein